MSKFDDIKNYILTNYPQFNEGYANVVKLDDNDILLDENLQLYAGINDIRGNFFYIRDMRSATYDPVQRGSRVSYYKVIRNSRIVAIYIHGNHETVLQILINSITAKGHTVTRSNTESTSVFKEETGKPLTVMNLVIVSVDFQIAEIMSPKDCSLNPCNC